MDKLCLQTSVDQLIDLSTRYDGHLLRPPGHMVSVTPGESPNRPRQGLVGGKAHRGSSPSLPIHHHRRLPHPDRHAWRTSSRHPRQTPASRRPHPHLARCRCSHVSSSLSAMGRGQVFVLLWVAKMKKILRRPGRLSPEYEKKKTGAWFTRRKRNAPSERPPTSITSELEASS